MLWSVFTPHVQVEVSMAPVALIESMLRRATIDLCRRGHPWVGDFAPITVVAGTAAYQLAAPSAQAHAFEPYSVWLDSKRLSFIPLDQMRKYGTYWPEHAGEVTAFTQVDDGTLTLYRKPEVGGTLRGLSALAPSATSTELPDWLGEKFFETIVAGAKARLFAMPKATWFDPNGATMYATIFDGGALSVAARRAGGKARGADSAPVGESQ
jgi:hypothetical protein